MPRGFASYSGSSPRLRGTQGQRVSHPCGSRFIPASAGNTIPVHSRTVPAPVHPRVCGEHGTTCLWRRISIGSSPRLRGTLSSIGDSALNMWFIPASAGNTIRLPCIALPVPVHPRVCGEHAISVTSNKIFQRFIPASAGNTQVLAAMYRMVLVHPRVCGEHYIEAQATNIKNGSSPRLRGTPQHQPRTIRNQRFIPASAGNTRM